MAKRRRGRNGRKAIAATAVALALLTATALIVLFGGWHKFANRAKHMFTAAGSPIAVSGTRIDPANEGRDVRISGYLEIAKQPVDPQLGISAKAAILFRHVEMYQWREQCSGTACRYDKLWSSFPIDSHGFRVQQGHENAKFPFKDAHFAAPDIKIGAFAIDPSLLINSATLAYPVRAAQLPPNLAMTFADEGGVLYAGADPAHPQIGGLRIGYRVLPLHAVTLTGVQRGSRLARN
ncbi:MAG: TMEM43 family protein [Rudaea sp.]